MDDLICFGIFLITAAFPCYCWISYERKNAKLRWRIIYGFVAIISTTFIALFLLETSKSSEYYAESYKKRSLQRISLLLKDELQKNNHDKKRKEIAIWGLSQFKKSLNKSDVHKEIKALNKLKNDLTERFDNLNAEEIIKK